MMRRRPEDALQRAGWPIAPPPPEAWVCIEIPRPPSTNALYRNVSASERASAANRGRNLSGRAKTSEYKRWRVEAELMVVAQFRPLPKITGQFFIDVDLPGGIDIDNLKAIPDLLKAVGIIDDDGRKFMRHLTIRAVNDEQCFVRLRQMRDGER